MYSLFYLQCLQGKQTAKSVFVNHSDVVVRQWPFEIKHKAGYYFLACHTLVTLLLVSSGNSWPKSKAILSKQDSFPFNEKCMKKSGYGHGSFWSTVTVKFLYLTSLEGAISTIQETTGQMNYPSRSTSTWRYKGLWYTTNTSTLSQFLKFS